MRSIDRRRRASGRLQADARSPSSRVVRDRHGAFSRALHGCVWPYARIQAAFTRRAGEAAGRDVGLWGFTNPKKNKKVDMDEIDILNNSQLNILNPATPGI